MKSNDGVGKGDRYRKVDYNKWSTNYDYIFRRKSPKDKFQEHLDHASDVVSKWPKWKRELLGGKDD